jgi:hypothetical protein
MNVFDRADDMVADLKELHHRAKMAWHVFRGHPLAYKIQVMGQIQIEGFEKTWISHCHVKPWNPERSPEEAAALSVLAGYSTRDWSKSSSTRSDTSDE